ncbi:MAG TPA: T9SS type A sorting domain-containing protein, partial [Chitinophagales bacterium]|nr:T9SS type A sorting domain-containing protein [Chitinophagales bacterium]
MFSFNRCNGEIEMQFNFSETYGVYATGFSSDGTKLYLGNGFDGKLYQYDLTAGSTGDEIKASRQLVYNCPDDEHYIGSMALGPDDKLYFTTFYPFGPETPSTDYNTYLNVIHNPNESGVACNVEDQAVWLCDGIAQIGLPNMPNYRLGALQGSECDTIKTAITDQSKPELQFTIYPNPASNYLQIETTSKGNNTIIIRDIKGSICYTCNFNSNTQIPVVHFADGVYSITIINDKSGVVWSDKFVKM